MTLIKKLLRGLLLNLCLLNVAKMKIRQNVNSKLAIDDRYRFGYLQSGQVYVLMEGISKLIIAHSDETSWKITQIDTLITTVNIQHFVCETTLIALIWTTDG